jgi:N-methylhydantoinase B
MGLKGGSGAIQGCDGYDHIGMIDASGGVLDQDYEMFEQQTPHRILQHEYRTDSAGAGEWRGGLGVTTRLLLGGENNTLVTFGEGDVDRPLGAFGGMPGPLNAMTLTTPDGKVVTPTTKDLIKDVKAGTVYYQEAGGGGGWGDPSLRKVARVLDDVRNAKVSVRSARDDYGVAIVEKSMTVDEAATAKLRAPNPR